MSFVAGRVMVPVVPDLRGFQKEIGGQGAVAGRGFSGGFSKAANGSRMGKVFRSTFVKSVSIGGGIGGALFSVKTLMSGFDRLTTIEDATESLTVSLKSAAKAGKLVDEITKVVTGTPFALDQFVDAGQNLVAFGVSAKKVPRYLTAIADAAATKGKRAPEYAMRLSEAFGQASADGRIMSETLNRLMEAGVPAVEILAKKFDMDKTDVRLLASKGALVGPEYMDAIIEGIEKNQGGLSKKLGTTLSGSLANAKISFTRAAANFIKPFAGQMTNGFNGVGKTVDKFGKRAGAFSAYAAPRMAKAASAITSGIRTLATRYGPTLISFVKTSANTLKDWYGIGVQVVKVLWEYKAVIGVLVGGLVAYKTIQLAVNAAGWASYLWQSREVIIGAARIGITNAMTASQIGLNAAMRANVLGIVITGLTLLVAGLVIAYKKSDTFRAIVNKTWAGIKTGLAVAWAYIKPVLIAFGDFLGKVIPPILTVLKNVFKVAFTAISVQVKVWWWAVRSYFGMLKAFLTGVVFPVIRFLYNNVVKPMFTKAGDIISTVWTSTIRPTFSKIQSAVGKVKDAFSTAVDGIKSVWNGIKDIMAKPVNWVINNVINKLIGAVNKIPGVKRIEPINPIGLDLAGGAKAGGSAGSKGGHGGKGPRGGRRGWGGKAAGSKSGGKRTWPANTRALSNNYAGHSGIDIAAAGGSPIRAASGGTVEYTGWGRGFGQALFVRGDDGLMQVYGHSSKVLVRAGQRVSAGQTIGLVGTTGNSSGNHLHFEIAKSAPGTTSNRAATLAWLGGAKMGSGSGASELDSFKASVGKVSAAGAPKGSWLNIGALTSYLKDAALSAGKSILGAPINAAKAVGSGARDLAGMVNPFGGIGGRGGWKPWKTKKPKGPKKPSLKTQLRKSRRDERRIERKLALAKKKSAKKQLKKQLAAQKRQSRLLNRRVQAQAALKQAKAMPSSLTAGGRAALLSPSAGMTIGSGAKITTGFLSGQLGKKVPSQEDLRKNYETAQSGLGAAGNKVAAADRQVAIARANARVGDARIKDIDTALKGKRTEASLKKSLTGANDKVAAAQKRLNNAKTASEKKAAQASLKTAKTNRDNIKRELDAVRKLQAEKAKLQNSKEAKALTAAEASRTQALADQAKAQQTATDAAEKYREAQDAAIERATNVKNVGIGLGSIASAGFKTAGGIMSNLRKAVSIVPAWSDVVKNLIAAGLRGPILEEFINAGPSAEAVFTGKSLLKSGGIGTINDLQNQLNAASIEAGALAGVDVLGAGATGGGIAGSWSSSSAPHMSAINPVVPTGSKADRGLTIAYSGMPSDTVESIAAKTSDRVITAISRAGA